MSLLEELKGPLGGVVAMAFGIGASAGYAFALRTALSVARERMKEMAAEIDLWRDKYLASKEG